MKAKDNSLYENVNVRICCQHGKPCSRSKQQRLVELGNFSSVALPMAQIEEENTYENLDPNNMMKKNTTKKEQFFMAEGKPIVVNRLPVEEKVSKKSEDDSDNTDTDRSQKKKKELAKSVYLGTVEWRKAERKLRGPVALYHLADDPEAPLFLLQRKRVGLRHFHVVQRCLNAGPVFLAEDGSASPKRCGSLDELVKFYKDKSFYKY